MPTVSRRNQRPLAPLLPTGRLRRGLGGAGEPRAAPAPVAHGLPAGRSRGPLKELRDFAVIQSHLDSAKKCGTHKLDTLRKLFTTGA
jgi:hypothetical protein